MNPSATICPHVVTWLALGVVSGQAPGGRGATETPPALRWCLKLLQQERNVS